MSDIRDSLKLIRWKWMISVWQKTIPSILLELLCSYRGAATADRTVRFIGLLSPIDAFRLLFAWPLPDVTVVNLSL